MNPDAPAPTCRHKPPTPPLHRCPSLESRIYELAQASLASVAGQPTKQTDQPFRPRREPPGSEQPVHLLVDVDQLRRTGTCAAADQRQPDHGAAAADFLPEGPSPVYTCFRGVASQVRPDPLSDLSSDNSDAEHPDCSPERRLAAGVRRHSIGDYDLPPDAVDGGAYDAPDAFGQLSLGVASPSAPATGASVSAPFIPLSYTLQRLRSAGRESVGSQAKFVDEQEEPDRKSGFLLCCKQKSWKQRYFVLQDEKLTYYKTQSDAGKGKPAGRIELNRETKVERLPKSSSFQISQSSSGGKRICLTADSLLTVEEWVRVSDQRRKQTDKITIC